jgi:tetratricopeptide (TPR) repeat protein
MNYDIRHMRNRYIFFLILLALPLFASAQESRSAADVKFKSAAALYSSGKYREALDSWLELYNSGFRSAALDYNIGNACFKLNDIPGSILYYERALLLRPGGEDIRYNLQISKSMTVDKLPEIPELFFVSWFNFVSLSLTSNSWAVLSMLSFIICLLSVSLYFYSKNHRYKVIGFWTGLVLLVFTGLTFAFSARNRSLVFNNEKGIIFSPTVNGKSSPDNSGNDLFVIHEGAKVTVGEKVGEWYEIRISDGNKGWVPSNCLQRL